jgi:hypothetical protein
LNENILNQMRVISYEGCFTTFRTVEIINDKEVGEVVREIIYNVSANSVICNRIEE